MSVNMVNIRRAIDRGNYPQITILEYELFTLLTDYILHADKWFLSEFLVE